MDLIVCPLFSGSKGNSTFIATDTTRILIDAGVTLSRLTDGLRQIGSDLSEIHAILVTHEHIDHIHALGMIARRYPIPIYATPGTWTAIRLQGRCSRVPPASCVEFDPGRPFCVRDLRILPIPTSHDAADPTGYAVDTGRHKATLLTDTGYIPAIAREMIKGSQIVVLESNHDISMLNANPHYPAVLKQRILGRRGHLNNGDASEFLCDLVRQGTTQVALAHLSQENNTPELAYDTAQQTLCGCDILPGRDLLLTVARQDRPVGLLGA